MKIYNKPIIVLSKTDTDGTLTPLRWKVQDENQKLQTYNILNVMKRDKRKIAGNTTCEILCETEINGVSRPCELRYNFESAQWTLFKI